MRNEIISSGSAPEFTSDEENSGALAVITIVTNTFINVLILRVLKNNWVDSFYFDALLSQIGVLSLILAAERLNSSIINQRAYQMIITGIVVSLLVSSLWASFVRPIFKNFSHKL